jgi:hypothetical protein
MMTIVHQNMRANFDAVIRFEVPEYCDFTSVEYISKYYFGR